MKVSISTLILLITTTTFAFGPAKLDSQSQLELAKDRVKRIVKGSRSFRESISVGRSVAGQSIEDIAWAKEFEALMNNSDDGVDYLGKAIDL